jgi:IclR family transcriptional regulator, acetate operon repressor
VRRVIELLEAVARAPDGASMSELARATELPKPTVVRYLQTLEEHGWVERDSETGRYMLGFAIPAPSQSYARIVRTARPSLERLSKSFGETAALGILDGHEVALLDAVHSTHRVQVVNRPEDRDFLHSSAVGKAIASTLPDDVVRRLLEAAGMPARTDRTITKIPAFLEELARVREQRFAVVDGENDVDARAVAVPMPVPRAHCALVLTGPTTRFSLDDSESMAAALRAEAAKVAQAVREEPQRSVTV